MKTGNRKYAYCLLLRRQVHKVYSRLWRKQKLGIIWNRLSRALKVYLRVSAIRSH